MGLFTSERSRLRPNLPVRAFLFSLLVVGFGGLAARGDDWPQWLGPKRDGVWRETGILKKFPQGGPKVLWQAPVGIGYAGPAVANGRVYLMDRVLADNVKNPDSGFNRNVLDGTDRVLCLDEKTGKLLWKHEYPSTYDVSYPGGPRVTPAVHEGKVYTVGTMGELFCLDADKGTVIWSKHFPKDYDTPVPQWGFAGHPLVDGKKLICLVGGKKSVAVAFDKDTGKELWRSLSAKEPGYSPPVIIDAGKARQLIIWHPEALNSLDPETGKVYWSVPFFAKAGLTAPMARQMGDYLFVSSFYNGSLMVRLDRNEPKASVVWQSKGKGEKPNQTADLNSIIATPFLRDGHIYGVCSYGELRCLKADTGQRIWSTLEATTGKETRWGNAFLIAHQDRFFLFNERGDLIIAKLTPQGYEEIDRAHILEPTNVMAGRPVVWMHPAFANKNLYARNDKEIVCVSLAEK